MSDTPPEIVEIKAMGFYGKEIGVLTKYSDGMVIAHVMEERLTNDVKRRLVQLEFVQDPDDPLLFRYNENKGEPNG